MNRFPRWFFPAVLWLAAGLLWLSATRLSGFAEWYAVTLYPLLVRVVGGLCSLLPFSLAEVLMYGGGLALTFWLLISMKRLMTGRMRGPVTGRPGILAHTLCILFTWGGVLALTFMLGCGINYHRVPFSVREGLLPGESTREELALFCLDAVARANEAAAHMNQAESGRCLLREDARETARQAVEALGERYVSLDGYYPLPKKLLNPRFLSVQKVTGIYSPFTMEANVNGEIPDYELAYTLCHELSHLKGFMREDEANFVAWLACRDSESPEFRYAAALEGFIYAGNDLYRYEPELYWGIRDALCPQAEADLSYGTGFWHRFDGKVAETHEKVNDAYLRANSQADGVDSYDRVVELMLAYMREQEGE